MEDTIKLEGFKKWTSIEKFSDAIIHAQRHFIKFAWYRAKVKLHGCLDGDTKVTLSNGEEVCIKDITKGTSILSYNTTTGEVENDVVESVLSKNIDINWIEMEFSDGTKIKCTEDHKFYTKNRGWVEAKDLTEEDQFVTI